MEPSNTKDISTEKITNVAEQASGEVDVTLSDGTISETLKSGGYVERDENGAVVERAELHDATTGELEDGPVIDGAAAALYTAQGLDVPATNAPVSAGSTTATVTPVTPIAPQVTVPSGAAIPLTTASDAPAAHASKLLELVGAVKQDASLVGHWFVDAVESIAHHLKSL